MVTLLIIQTSIIINEYLLGIYEAIGCCSVLYTLVLLLENINICEIEY